MDENYVSFERVNKLGDYCCERLSLSADDCKVRTAGLGAMRKDFLAKRWRLIFSRALLEQNAADIL